MGGVSEGEEEEDEENDAQHVGGEDGGPVRVLQGGADGGEAHVVAEGVAEHRTHQVTCNTERQRPSPALSDATPTVSGSSPPTNHSHAGLSRTSHPNLFNVPSLWLTEQLLPTTPLTSCSTT